MYAAWGDFDELLHACLEEEFSVLPERRLQGEKFNSLSAGLVKDEFSDLFGSEKANKRLLVHWVYLMYRHQFLMESLILAQNERWRRG